MNTTRSRERGFSLLETLVATSILTVTLAGLAQLLTVSMRANAAARTTTYAALLAQQKMEQLRGLTWGFDLLGLPVADTSTNVAAASAAGLAAKADPSPPMRSATNRRLLRFRRSLRPRDRRRRHAARRNRLHPAMVDRTAAGEPGERAGAAGAREPLRRAHVADTGATGVRSRDEACVSVRTRKAS